MNKYVLYILFLGVGNLWGQQKEDLKPSYQKFQREYKYVKKKGYTGPENNYNEPAPMEESSNNGGPGYNGLQYSPQQIQKSRESRKSTTDRGGSTGNKPYDPAISEPEKIDFDPPEIDGPDVDLPDVDPPAISPNFWKILLFIIGFVLLAWIIYLIVKNHKPKNLQVTGNFSPSDWNPEIIPKTELELRLEAAMLNEDFRECVRIYFTFILKELIRLRRIKWKKELTNFDYIIQMSGKKGAADFDESVRIYDLVWYGDYEITAREYEALVPHLEKNYQSLTAEHE